MASCGSTAGGGGGRRKRRLPHSSSSRRTAPLSLSRCHLAATLAAIAYAEAAPLLTARVAFQHPARVGVGREQASAAAHAASGRMIGTYPALPCPRGVRVPATPLTYKLRCRTHHRRPVQTSRLSLSAAASPITLPLPLPSTPSALSTLLLSSLAGTAVDRLDLFNVGSSGTGTIVSLLVAALLSNLGLAPASHRLYDVCWTKLLPGSLVLILLSGAGGGGSGEGTNVGTDDDDEEVGNDDATIRDSVAAVSVPFLIGSLGSVIGCVLAFLISLVLSPTAYHTSRWTLPPLDAAVAAGCLCSSYVGGSVNFFGAARILATRGFGQGNGEDAMGSLLSSMAAADLLVMALYFAGMAAAVRSGFLRRLFPGRDDDGTVGDYAADATNDEVETFIERTTEPLDSTVTVASNGAGHEGEEPATSERTMSGRKRRRRRLIATVVASSLAWGIVGLSAKFERAVASRFDVPGMGCAAIAALGTAAGWALRKLQIVYAPDGKSSSLTDEEERRGRTQRIIFPPPWLAREIDAVCPLLSDLCFTLLFAAIGTSANVADALRHGPASVLFAAFALAVHVMVTLIGSWGVMKLLPRFRLFPLGLEEVMVASNAAIGGPATAAAFAGSLGGGTSSGRKGGKADASQSRKKTRRRGLVMAATVWGVFGYAVATGIGVALSGALLEFLRAEFLWEVPMHP